MDDPYVYKLEGYEPAIDLALNVNRGRPIEVEEWQYDEFYDIVRIMAKDENGLSENLTLEGRFIRSCFLATKRGISSWSNPDA